MKKKIMSVILLLATVVLAVSNLHYGVTDKEVDQMLNGKLYLYSLSYETSSKDTQQ